MKRLLGNTVTTILFDVDGTIIDETIYAKMYSKIINLIQEKLNLNNFQINKKAKNYGLKKNKLGRWDTGELCKLFGLLNDYYLILNREINRKPPLNKRVANHLNKLKEDEKTIGIVSNSFRKTIRLYLKKYSLPFNFIYSSDDAKCKKDNKKFWLKLIRKRKLNPKECLVIGNDLIEDQKIPRSVGFRTLRIHKITP
ncbi:HAD family hydrolase [Candidatus Woesearchaeota archaeon]|nr:HAD family hydrolase [Candidatus Woesearchaeota archaeon]